MKPLKPLTKALWPHCVCQVNYDLFPITCLQMDMNRFEVYPNGTSIPYQINLGRINLVEILGYG